MTDKPHLIVIGNGMAGCRAVEEVLARDPARYAVTIFGAEPRVNYNRIMLSPVLAGEKAFDDIVINPAEWYDDNGITLISGDPVVHIDRKNQTVIARSGRIEPYDRLLIATGSDPFIIPVPGKDLAGVCRELGVSEAIYHRWRNQFGGLKADDAKRLKDLERENPALMRLLADAELEKAALKEIATGNFCARSDAGRPYTT
jgi:NADPH-dependent 2,4-dienoyl-CoA reductase/sulfur reductase-like enzyme